LTRPGTARNIDTKSPPTEPPAMNTPNPDTRHPLVAELEERRQALIRLRAQMLQLHARLEYLRLMIRLTGRSPQG
jgi:hypothetical protein